MGQRDRCRECRNSFNPRRNDWKTGRHTVSRHKLGYCLDCFRRLNQDGSLTEKLEALRREELLRDINHGVANGHHGDRCVDLDNWRFCTGLRFAIERCEAAGCTREAIRAAYSAAVAHVAHFTQT